MTLEPQHPYDQEARKIYSAIFGGSAPPVVLERFAAASELLERGADPAEVAGYRRAVAACDDLEALEIAARYLRRSKLLTRKFRLMVYLAETLPENQRFFINERSSFVGGFARSAAGTLRTLFKMAKGVWLLRRLPYAS